MAEHEAGRLYDAHGASRYRYALDTDAWMMDGTWLMRLEPRPEVTPDDGLLTKSRAPRPPDLPPPGNRRVRRASPTLCVDRVGQRRSAAHGPGRGRDSRAAGARITLPRLGCAGPAGECCPVLRRRRRTRERRRPRRRAGHPPQPGLSERWRPGRGAAGDPRLAGPSSRRRNAAGQGHPHRALSARQRVLSARKRPGSACPPCRPPHRRTDRGRGR